MELDLLLDIAKEKSSMAVGKCCNVNLKYLPIKAHYFFLFGGLAGTVPFMQVFAKDLGITATAVGLIYTIVPFCIFFAKPLFGYLTDLYRNIKAILMTLGIVTAVAFLAVLLVPPIDVLSEEILKVTTHCINDHNQFIIQPSSHDSLCLQEMAIKHTKCKHTSNYCLEGESLYGTLNLSHPMSHNENISIRFTLDAQKHFPSVETCNCLATNYSYIFCESNVTDCASQRTTEEKSVYATYNFWTYAFLAIIAGTGSATLFCLSDAACYEVLGQNPRLYGRQRLWATISWGIITFLAGYLNDIATKNSTRINYSPGFYLMLAFVIVDLILLVKLQLVKVNISTNIWKDIGQIYSSWRTVIFSLGVYIIGALTGLLWNYEFWYLSDLGANQTLLGLVIAVQCLVAEVPFFFFSEWFIVTFGHFYCLVGAFGAFAIRTGLYVLLNDPWMVLPIDVLHGITFAIFYTSMTLYAADFSPPGTEATMLGVLGGLYEGLGVATGSLLGGFGFDRIGGRQTFLVASIISLVCVPFFIIAYNIIRRYATFDVEKASTSQVTDYGTDNPTLQKDNQKYSFVTSFS